MGAKGRAKVGANIKRNTIERNTIEKNTRKSVGAFFFLLRSEWTGGLLSVKGPRLSPC